MHILDIFNYYRANINGMRNAGKLGGIYKTFEFTAPKSYTVLLSIKVLPQKFYCESFTGCKIDVKHVNTVKSTTWLVRVKSNRMFETKHWKTNQLQKTIKYQTYQ